MKCYIYSSVKLLNVSLAQLAERLTVNQNVAGSSPARCVMEAYSNGQEESLLRI